MTSDGEWDPVAPAPTRLEDRRLVHGAGRYLQNLPRPRGCLFAVIVRSTYPHGQLTEVVTRDAEAASGVRGVLTGRDLLDVLAPFPNIVSRAPDYLPIAIDRVRYVGEPVAVVVAETYAAALDAADLVTVAIEPFDAVDGIATALRGDAPRVHDEVGGNVVWERTYSYGNPDAAFEQADHVIRTQVRFPRYNSTPLETYGVTAQWLGAEQSYDVVSNFQGPFSLLSVLARGLRVSERQLRLKVPEDIGGSFGIKAMVYPYIALIAACSRVLGRPVTWNEQRSEHLIGSASGTERHTEVEVAVTNRGEVTAIRTDIVEEVGAYLRAPEPSCVMRSLTLFSGPYRIGHGQTRARLVLTNRLPTGLNRGYGGQQHSFTIERVMDAVARHLGLDPVAVRRVNLLRPDELPLTTAAGTRYDSGDYHACLDRALELVGYEALMAERSSADRDAKAPLIGVGLATVIHSAAANIGYVTLALPASEREKAGYLAKSGARDTAEVALLPNGRIRVRIATAGAGQGHATTAAQIAGGILGVGVDSIDVIDQLDTAEPLWGTTSGSYSSRFSVVVGGAVARAAHALGARLKHLASFVLEADEDDLDLVGGSLQVRGVPSRSLSLRTLAGAVQWNPGSFPHDISTDIIATASYSPPDLEPPDAQDRVNAASTYGFMADVAVVEIDRETGRITLRSYVAVHDVGRALNPVIIKGQIAGGIAHGVAGALFEHVDYDGFGHPRASTLVDYLCPSAAEFPSFTIDHHDVPSPFNHLGVKGCGENSAMSAPAVIAAAVEDALAPFGVVIDALPLTPEFVWRVIQHSGVHQTREI